MKQGLLEGIATTALRRSATNILTKALTRLIEPVKEPKHLVKNVVKDVHPLYYVNTAAGFIVITEHNYGVDVTVTRNIREATPFATFAVADAIGRKHSTCWGRKRQYYAVVQPSYG